MANIIVCYKWVVDEADVKFSISDYSLDNSRAKSKVSDYDRNAIEEGSILGKQTGDNVVALTFGNSEAKKSLKEVLSRGVDEAFWVNDELANEADGFVTAEVLAAAINKIGDCNIIICAEGASDTYARQIGPRIGAILNLPVITCVNKLGIEGTQITASRKLESLTEIVVTEAPAVVCVMPEINKPPIPSLKQALAASKKPVTELAIRDLGLESEMITPKRIIKSLKAYTMERKNIMLKEDSAAEKVKQLVERLREEGVV